MAQPSSNDPARNQPTIYLELDATQTQLLTGLDTLLTLGLISTAQVEAICQTQLSCSLPERVVTSSAPLQPSTPSSPPTQPSLSHRPHHVVLQAWQALKDELSVRWLLFLGLFLVVVSSGVLAASQWERFSAIAQYGVLWSYTVLFWWGGTWATGQRRLSLTAQTLQTITLLLIPVNFWAMASLMGSLGGEFAIVLAALSLMGIYWRQTQDRPRGWLTANFLLLCVAHLTWGRGGLPMVGLYGGTLMTALLVKLLPLAFPVLLRSRRNSPYSSGLVRYALAILFVRAIFIDQLSLDDLGLAIGLYGWLLPGGIPAQQTRQRPPRRGHGVSHPQELSNEALATSSTTDETTEPTLSAPDPPLARTIAMSTLGNQVLEIIGIVLLLIAWLCTFHVSLPWQAVIISCLALQVLFTRLYRNWQRRELLAIFLVGYQLNFLLWSFLSPETQLVIAGTLTNWAKSQATPWAIYGVSLWPFLGLFVSFTNRLYRRSHLKVAQFGEWLALFTGVILAMLAAVNPVWRALNLGLATVTLSYLAWQRPNHRGLRIYVAHAVGLGAIAALVNVWQPRLVDWQWGTGLMGLAIAQWLLSPRWELREDRRQRWLAQSFWHYGWGLAAISYGCFWQSLLGYLQTPESEYQGALWGFIPMALTLVACRSSSQRRPQAAFGSCLGLVILQVLTFWEPGVQLVGLGGAALLMVVNTRLLVHPLIAMLQIGLSLSFVATFLWGKISPVDGLLVGAIAILGLWILRVGLRRAELQRTQRDPVEVANKSPDPFIIAYLKAVDAWLAILSVALLMLLSFRAVLVTLAFSASTWQAVGAVLILGIALLWQAWRRPSNRTVLAILLLAEIALVEMTVYFGGNHLTLATANVLLALGTWGGTQWVLAQRSPWSNLAAVALAPMGYALVSIICRLGMITPVSGLWTLGAAIASLGAASRRQNWKGLNYLALAGVTLGSYELLLYHILYLRGFRVADELTMLSLITAALALTYRLFAWQWHQRGHQQFLGLSLPEIAVAAHVHWALGSLIKPFAARAAFGKVAYFTPLSLTISLMLSSYALVQGRDPAIEADSPVNRVTDWWIYMGVLEVGGTFIYARLIWSQLKILDPYLALIVCLVALVIYQMPWHTFGWRTNVWQRIALVIPGASVLVTYASVSYLSLLLVVLFYGLMAILQRNIRWSYVSLGFFNWAIARWFTELQWTDHLLYACLIGGTLIFIAQVDPILGQPAMRQRRHYLRLFGSSLMGGIAVLTHQATGLIPAAMGLTSTFIGLGLRIRAFLFVGTLTFLLTAFYQLIITAFTYPLAKWLIGLGVGILLIAIAANFERRREQILTVLQNWLVQLRQWE